MQEASLTFSFISLVDIHTYWNISVHTILINASLFVSVVSHPTLGLWPAFCENFQFHTSSFLYMLCWFSGSLKWVWIRSISWQCSVHFSLCLKFSRSCLFPGFWSDGIVFLFMFWFGCISCHVTILYCLPFSLGVRSITLLFCLVRGPLLLSIFAFLDKWAGEHYGQDFPPVHVLV